MPRNDVMYKDATSGMLAKTGSRGATLYGLLELENDSVRTARTFWQRDIEIYDIIIFADINEYADLFYSLYKRLGVKAASKLCIIDGYDTPSRFPFYNLRNHLRYFKRFFFYPLRKVAYFKREYESYSALFGIARGSVGKMTILANKFAKKPTNILPISMSVPEECIEYWATSKKPNEFVSYNIDKDLEEIFDYTASSIGEWKPLYPSQGIYEQDIRESKFGITMKRKGWDCLRHYEYAAKGTILCFKNLNIKPSFGAPFDLNETNCILYTSLVDLKEKLDNLTDKDIIQLQENTYRWIQSYTTKNVALKFIDCFSKYIGNQQ